MEYAVNQSGKRIIINVLANATKSLIGLQIGDSRIISVSYTDLFDLVLSIYGLQAKWGFEETMAKYHVMPLSDAEDDSAIVMETIENSENSMPIAHDLPDMLKLYQSADIFSCYSLTYRFENGRIHSAGMIKNLLYEHAIHWPWKPYEITDEGRAAFSTWFDKHQSIMHSEQNQKFQQIKRLYLESYLTGDANLSFIMLSVVLEMIFGGTVELTYRISRGTSLFLSTSKTEMKTIFKQAKDLYNIRSKYVHEGRSVEWDKLFDLRELVRRVIILTFERNMHKPDFDFKKFSEDLTYDGYSQE